MNEPMNGCPRCGAKVWDVRRGRGYTETIYDCGSDSVDGSFEQNDLCKLIVKMTASLTAELAAVKRERDQFKAICECVLEELNETGVEEMSSEWCAIQNEITGALAPTAQEPTSPEAADAAKEK